ncbi:hypothetical protein [Caulobacter endophyticus]|uniref:hypothetical protein n=1 Tax=Caulobacter endophyticus TaxID=2172652 RepID=UPI00240F6A86|nr:hypothetical protein [Caulobacter endophyticus]MDG2529334.1 hypothetical protein [Caulobacter endophyticus]
MKRLRTALLALGLAWAGQALATTYYEPPPPSLAQLRSPAGVAEYRDAADVALVRPTPAWTPPCFVVRLAAWLRQDAPGWLDGDVCTAFERSRRYDLDLIETFKGQPQKRFPALLDGAFPVDPTFLHSRRLDLWKATWGIDSRRAHRRHAGFLFLHRGSLADRRTDIEGPMERPRYSDGAAPPMLDPGLDYLVFLDGERRITHWEPVARGQADQDLLVRRLRLLRGGQGEDQVRLTAAPADVFARFSDAAIYEVSPVAAGATPPCRPRMIGGHKIAYMDLALDIFGSEMLGPVLPCRPGDPPRRYLALKVVPSDWSPFGWSERGADARLLPIIDGKVRPGDLVTQLRLAPADPIPVEQVLAWIGTGVGETDRWLGRRDEDPPLRVDAAGAKPYLHGPSPAP